MNHRPLTLAAVLLSAIASTARAAQVESWSDPALPVKAGLVAWYDAARQPTPHSPGDEVSTFSDGSGYARHLTAPTSDARPTLVGTSGVAAVRFDGLDDHLLYLGREALGNAVTAVVVAAPRTNGGGFAALLAATDEPKNDFQTGFTIDLGPMGAFGKEYSFLNVEGAGFVGAGNLLGKPLPFDSLKTFTVTTPAPSGDVTLYVDGAPAGRRKRTGTANTANSLSLGARRYNFTGPASPSGFFDGDIAEVLLYDRVLTADELTTLHAYLSTKHKRTAESLAQSRAPGQSLNRLETPPAVQIFLPGFTARELPVDLTNINNVRYREDGKLVAVAYDGNVYLLSDTDNDGLEDKADLFWDNKDRIVSPIGACLTPPGYARGRGLFIPSKGKLSLVVDTDSDDKADKEIVVATGWPGAFHTVDALGAAIDKDGTVYFGIGTPNFADGYLRDKEGKSHYDLKDHRGTILKVSPDLATREIVCTGIRFPVGLAFNRNGDLFCSDQEGATWLPNGNPLDELLHIRPGLHYGFPPRHPKHLPNVIDEPSTFDYAPQHQSTCGLFFNGPVNNGPTFGPAIWSGDALVTAESRGKLYRTKLAKTPAGYVATNQILGSLPMLTIDNCVSPKGDLVVAVHSGAPDWGSGPKGKGKLYKISYRNRDLPQPVAIYSAAADEVQVAFDKPLDPAYATRSAKEATIEYGPYVAAGDRFEVIWPGYAVVQRQVRTPRHKLDITGARLSDDRRTLILSTTRQTRAVGYALTLPGFDTPAAKGEIQQLPQIDIAYDLTGVAAAWDSADSSQHWFGWLPHADLAVAREFTTNSSRHAALFNSLKSPGRLTLRASLDLWQMLHPAVQPGSHLDYEPSPETVTVTFESNTPIGLKSSSPAAAIQSTGTRATLTVVAKPSHPIPIELTVPTGSTEPTLTVSFTTNEDSRPRPLALRRFLLPWARPDTGSKSPVDTNVIPELAGGDWARGRALFFGTEAACSRCHRVRGDGSDLGPDLSNLVHRDYDSVLRDIQTPSAAINPDYIASTVRLKDGRVLAGIARDSGPDHIRVRGDTEGEKSPIARADIEKMSPAKISLMPTGIPEALGPDKLRDLLTFLLTEPLTPAPLRRPDVPPARYRSEVDAIFKQPTTKPADLKPLHILLVSGPKDHGPDEHDYPLWRDRWSTLLKLADKVTVSTADRWPTPDQFAAADVAVFYSANPDWSDDRAKELDAFLHKGGGALFLHFAVNGQRSPDALAKRIGLAWGPGAKFRHGPLPLTLRDTSHPITQNFPANLHFVDESYWNLTGDPARIHVLADTLEDGQSRPILWTYQPQPGGRVFVSIAGHYTWTFDDPLFRLLLLRAIAWSADQPIDRLSNLATTGARVKDGY